MKYSHERRMTFYKLMAVLLLVYGSEYCVTKGKYLRYTQKREMKFLRSVEGYRKLDIMSNEQIK